MKLRGSTQDVRMSQQLPTESSTAGLEKRILKGGQNIMRNQTVTRSSTKNRKYFLFSSSLTSILFIYMLKYTVIDAR